MRKIEILIDYLPRVMNYITATKMIFRNCLNLDQTASQDSDYIREIW